MVQRHFEEDHLYANHDQGLDQQGSVVLGTGVVEHSARISAGASRFCKRSYLRKDATSMINGMSREKPALDLVLCIEYVWSA